jgi:hypothetical protein
LTPPSANAEKGGDLRKRVRGFFAYRAKGQFFLKKG